MHSVVWWILALLAGLLALAFVPVFAGLIVGSSSAALFAIVEIAVVVAWVLVARSMWTTRKAAAR